jgi:hypothetical protein
VFERFEWPLQRYVDLSGQGDYPWLHLDTDWGINLLISPNFQKESASVTMDSTTDIFQAKEILKGHMCISRDVPRRSYPWENRRK